MTRVPRKGPNGATQTINDFLPEHHTDFIFAVVAEMFGFLGAGLLICIYLVIIWRAVGIMRVAATQMEQLMAAGYNSNPAKLAGYVTAARQQLAQLAHLFS